MTERAWTPGPWHTKAEFDHMIVHRETGGVVADCAITVPGPVTDDELRANARLIAQAPVMAEYVLQRAQAGDAEARKIAEALNA